MTFFPHNMVSGKSTCTQLLFALNKWHYSFDNNVDVDVIHTNFAKAFDTVSLTKLNAVVFIWCKQRYNMLVKRISQQ